MKADAKALNKQTNKQSFFELQTPDFAWKFICTVQPNEKVQKVQKYKNSKLQKNDKNVKSIQKSLDTAHALVVI